jgi:pimeloyl-ACP methyl ester carboxylesterase
MPNTVAASANDLGRLLDVQLGGRPLNTLIGHSLGGKVVLDLLTQRRDTPPTKQVQTIYHSLE